MAQSKEDKIELLKQKALSASNSAIQKAELRNLESEFIKRDQDEFVSNSMAQSLSLNKKILIIGGSLLLVVAIIVVVVYKAKKV